MLSSFSRSAYICFQCRSRLSHNLLQKSRPLLRDSTLRNPISLPKPRAFVSSALRPQHAFPSNQDDQDPNSDFTDDTLNRWTKLGLRPVVAGTLLRAFPNAVRPTTVQKSMLTALTYGYSVAARGLPGSGKSFAIATWLLGLERAMRQVKVNEKAMLLPTTSALVIVPNVDLGIQYYETMINLLEHSDSEAIRSNPHAFVQLLYRKSNRLELDQLVTLQNYPHPHIIIAPPTILLDILADKSEPVRNLLDISNLKTIVLEEIDAAITKMQYFSKMKRAKKLHQWQNKQTPLQILLDYIIQRRRADAMREGRPINQPQLVFPTATLSAAQIKHFLFIWHRDWLHADERTDEKPRTFNSPKPGEEWKRRARSNSLLAIEDPPLQHDKITQFVGDNLRHHVIAFDIRSNTLRDAPLPKIEFRDRKKLVGVIEELEEGERADIWLPDVEPSKFCGYPIDITVSTIKQLLEKDNYPSNVIVAVGSEVDLNKVRERLIEAGIDAQPLLAKRWNDRASDSPSILPLGRTDMMLSRDTREAIISAGKGGDSKKTTVWLTNFFFCRGLNTPGIRHFYILHRIDRAREYITYCGRVATWPFPALVDELKDPRSLGRDRRGMGKVVSVILEDRMLDDEGKPVKASKKNWWEGETSRNIATEALVLKVDGSVEERKLWAWEAVRLAKLGCKVDPFFSVEEETEVEVEKEEGGEEVRGNNEIPAFLMEALGLLDKSPSKPESATKDAGEDEKKSE